MHVFSPQGHQKLDGRDGPPDLVPLRPCSAMTCIQQMGYTFTGVLRNTKTIQSLKWSCWNYTADPLLEKGTGQFRARGQELLFSVAPALFPCNIRAGNLPLAAHAPSMQNKVCSSHLYYQDYLQPTWLRSCGRIGVIWGRWKMRTSRGTCANITSHPLVPLSWADGAQLRLLSQPAAHIYISLK